MNIKAKREEMAKELSAAKALQAKGEMTAEELATAKAHLAKFDTLKAEVEEAESVTARIDARTKYINAPQGRKTAPDEPEQTAGTTNITTHDNQLDNPTRGYDGKGGFGRFAAEVHALNGGRGASEGIRRISAAAGDGLSAGVTAEGGVLVPPAFSTTIQDRIGMASDNLLADTDQTPSLPYGVESMEYPVVNETSRADGSRAGGIQGRWKSELGQMSESKPKLRSVKLEPQELYVFCYVSDKLLKHAAQLESFLTQRAADEINFKLGDSIINGTGAGQPRGILTGATDAPRVQVSKESSQAAATINITNLEKMFARLPARLASGAKWYINQDVWPQLLALTKNTGTAGVPVFMPGNNISGSPYGSIYGLPVKVTEYNATLGTEGDIILANLKEYGTVTRGGVESAMSIHLKFDFNQTAFRFIFEADGQPWWSSSLTPYKGTNKQSPFVTLATRS